jgi:hypothetical protein
MLLRVMLGPTGVSHSPLFPGTAVTLKPSKRRTQGAAGALKQSEMVSIRHAEPSPSMQAGGVISVQHVSLDT